MKKNNGQWVVKLSDFHRSKLTEREDAEISVGVKGTAGWRSPELYTFVKRNTGEERLVSFTVNNVTDW